MVVVDLNNINDNIPTITCEPVEVMEGLSVGFPITAIAVSMAIVLTSNYCMSEAIGINGSNK